jgi:hypothetical protein
MKPAALVGVILIILGVVALAYQGITYTTQFLCLRCLEESH